MGRYNHSLSLDATIMVSKNYPITAEHVVIIFVTQENFKLALKPMHIIFFLNFAKSCVLSCLSKVDDIEKFHPGGFKL